MSPTHNDMSIPDKPRIQFSNSPDSYRNRNRNRMSLKQHCSPSSKYLPRTRDAAKMPRYSTHSAMQTTTRTS